MKLIQELWVAFGYQQLQQEAAMHAWRGEYKEAVMKMVGSYCELELEGFEIQIKQKPVPRWLTDPTTYQVGQVPSIAGELTRRSLASMGGKGGAAAEILAGDYGLAMQTMAGLTFESLLEAMPANIDALEAKRITSTVRPWDDLVVQMKPPVKTWDEIGIRSRAGEVVW
jgi:hypothetical protein